MYFFFFFFQAEDGIRDLTVTGVQTCALPISLGRNTSSSGGEYGTGVSSAATIRMGASRNSNASSWMIAATDSPIEPVRRSEERRVGKECRSRWSPDQ